MTKQLLKEIKKVKDSNGGYVYVILANDQTVKIGVTVQPYERFRQIETASGKVIINWTLSNPCSNYLEIEKSMHDEYKLNRLEGEWFKCKFDIAKESLNKYKIQKIKYESAIDRCRKELNAIAFIKSYLEEFKYKQNNELKFKYSLTKWNENKVEIDKIKNMIQEQIEYTNAEFREEADYLNEDRYRYLLSINKGENIRESVQEYCMDYINDLQEEDFAKEILIQYGDYELFTNILGIQETIKNYIVDFKVERLINNLKEEFLEEYNQIIMELNTYDNKEID